MKATISFDLTGVELLRVGQSHASTIGFIQIGEVSGYIVLTGVTQSEFKEILKEGQKGETNKVQPRSASSVPDGEYDSGIVGNDRPTSRRVRSDKQDGPVDGQATVETPERTTSPNSSDTLQEANQHVKKRIRRTKDQIAADNAREGNNAKASKRATNTPRRGNSRR